ncbi:RNA polymerase sigma-70 factor [Pedobacter sp. MC2016-14]|uniref:RNA polymerase sigma-70 factor n=1 Tax=Pedobacter sp. MC2016-14 TaxID=2897327 RepID=UPI001E506A06|nr:RNA polymerase sigma-70 factor [Pedobacter sp. MC2016-14]MCD0489690.1 RNA polymerase sigma-70 factor [Pedobacter sp. MC2016-14]
MGTRLEYKIHTDADLLALIKEGKEIAFAELYERYWAQLYLYAMKVFQDPQDAEDAVQEVLAYVWSKRGDHKITGSLSSYLYSSVRYAALNMIRRKKIHDRYLDSFSDFLDKGANATDDYIQEKELIKNIEKAVATLPKKMREVFELSRNEQMTQKEIATKLNLSDKTVKKQVVNALKIIRMKISQVMVTFLL